MRKTKSDERALWHHATRDVKPIHRHQEPAPIAKKPDDTVAEAARIGAHPVPRPRAKIPTAPATAPKPGLDRRSAQRLRRGQMPIEARLDLHGMTQTEAHDALARFIARSHAAGLRAVLVITGKSGVLHGAVPRWLDEGENRPHILARERAQPQHGGGGALYLLLRRRR